MSLIIDTDSSYSRIDNFTTITEFNCTLSEEKVYMFSVYLGIDEIRFCNKKNKIEIKKKT